MAYWKYLIWFLLLYLSGIVQVSFLPHLSIWGVTPDLIFLVVFFWIFLAPKEKKFIYALAVFGGLLLEAYSDLPFFGLWIIALFLTVLLVKKLGSIMQGLNIFSLFIVFSINFLCFKFIPLILTSLFTLVQKKILFFPLPFSWKYLAISWGFDLIIAIICFYFYEFFHQKKSQRN